MTSAATQKCQKQWGMLESMETLDALATTRAIRRYRPDPILTADLAQILFAATRAPSGSNRQPFRFLVLRDGPAALEARALLRRGFQELWAAKRSAEAYDEGSGADPNSAKARMARTMEHFVDHIHEAPVIVLACLKVRRGAHLTEGASVYPACQNLLVAARDLGYGGVLTMWHQAVEEEMRDVLGIPEDVTLAACIPLGRPVGRHGPVRRRPLQDLVAEDRWEQPAPWAQDPPGTAVSRGRPHA